MSPSFDPNQRARLTVETDCDLSEIIVVNGAFEKVAKGVGHWSGELPAGVYKVRVLWSGWSREQLVFLDPSQSETRVNVEITRLETPIPIRDAVGFDPALARGVARLTRLPVLAGSETSRTMLFVHPAPLLKTTTHTDLLDAFSLIDENDQRIAIPDAQKLRNDPDSAAWAGFVADCKPGMLRLRWHDDSSPAQELSLSTTAGHSTWVFLHLRQTGTNALQPDFRNAAIALRSRSDVFQPGDVLLKLSEIARAAVTARRRDLSPGLRRRILDEKSFDPMLGLLGALLLLHDRAFDQDFYNTIVGKLATQLGNEHPDVMALRLRSGVPPPTDLTFSTPPMLQGAWKLLLQAAATSPEMLPEHSLCAAISPSVEADSPWVHWQGATRLIDDKGKRRWRLGTTSSALESTVETPSQLALRQRIWRELQRNEPTEGPIDFGLPTVDPINDWEARTAVALQLPQSVIRATAQRLRRNPPAVLESFGLPEELPESQMARILRERDARRAGATAATEESGSPTKEKSGSPQKSKPRPRGRR